MASISNRLRHAWEAFSRDNELDQRRNSDFAYGGAFSTRPDRVRFQFSNERSIISSIYTRIGIDYASVDIKHVRLDDKSRYLEDMDSGLNNCLTLEANLDQGGSAFRQDLAMTLCDKGVVAVVPVKTSIDPGISASYEIHELRVGEIVAWYPRHVRVSVYNDKKGRRDEIVMEKKNVAIIENPLYAVMNEPNSTLQRIIRKLNMLDAVDEQSSSGKLDLIIQLPYVIKSESRRQQAEQRRQDIEMQLKGSQYGIAYTDGTEKITQLNRAAENNLWKQIQDLLDMLYGQLGLTPEIMNGTADEKAMLNYWNRTIEPMLRVTTEAMRRSFLTKTARTQKQSVMSFRDPFKLVPIEQIAEIADKFTRNEIASSNEIRQVIGMPPSDDPKADELRNANMPVVDGAQEAAPEVDGVESDTGIFDEVDKMIDDVFNDLGVDDGD